MIFFVALGGLFALYGLDLLVLVTVAAIARAKEVAALLKEKRTLRHRQRNKHPSGSKVGKGGKVLKGGEGGAANACQPPAPQQTQLEKLQPSLPDLKLAASLVKEKGRDADDQAEGGNEGRVGTAWHSG
jgi:hypothetical protein